MAKLNKNEDNLNRNNKRLRLKKFSKSERLEKLKQKNAFNRLTNVPQPPEEQQKIKSNLTVNDLPTSKILDENGNYIRIYQNLGEIPYKTSEHRYKVISIANNNILSPHDFKEKFLHYKRNYTDFFKDINVYNDSLDNTESNKIIEQYNHIQTAKIDKKSYLGLQNNLICDFISNVFEPTILLNTKKEIIKHVKSYTAKAKALDWTKTATITRLTFDKEKYYNSVDGLDEWIKETISDHWDKANYKARWKAIIFNYKNTPNRLEKIRLEKITLDLYYFKWWAKKTNFGEKNISQKDMFKELNISELTANTILKKIKKEQGKTVKTKGDNTKEKVKNWFLKNGNYRGSNNDCSKQLDLSEIRIKEIKNTLKKEGVILPKIKIN